MQSTNFLDNIKHVKERQTQQNVKKSLQADQFNFNAFNPHNLANNHAKSFDSAAVEDSDPLFPKIRLVSRYIPRESLQATIPPNTEALTITELYKQVSPPEFKRPPQAAPNFVLFGIVATRSVTRTSARGNKFVTLLLSDLKYDISLALHGKAHEKFWKVRPGTLLALFNPQFYVQKFEGTARTLAVSVAKERCLLEVGQAKDLGQCEAMTSSSQHSKRCKNWVDTRKTHVCDFHVEQKATKTKRPEFNASSAKLWDPRSGGKSFGNGGGAGDGGKRLTVYQGGEVPWKRGLQVDAQASYGRNPVKKSPFGFGGFPDAPVGKVFQSETSGTNRNDRKLYEESLEDKKKRELNDRRKLERITDDARLKSSLGVTPTSTNSWNVHPSRVSKESNAKPNNIFARTQLRKLGFNPVSHLIPTSTPSATATAPIASSRPSSLPRTASSGTTKRPATERPQTQEDSDSDLEII